jgi:uncharacterized protein (DUF302 family)
MSDVAETTNPQGVVRRKSPWSVTETVERLVATIEAAGATVFTTVDHSGEAERVGLSLRETKVLVFGNPAAGTPLMQVQPLVALDLPLKILVWRDDSDEVWMTWLAGPWLAERYGIATDLAKVLSAPDGLTRSVADRSPEPDA